MLFLGKHKYIRMKLMSDNSIQINTILDKKTSYILFESSKQARKVYTMIKSKKKEAIMKELTMFSENVEAFQEMLHSNLSTDTFDIITRTFRKNKGPKTTKRPSRKRTSKRNILKDRYGKRSRSSRGGVELRKKSGAMAFKEYNPHTRQSEIKQFITPVQANFETGPGGRRKRFMTTNNPGQSHRGYQDPNIASDKQSIRTQTSQYSGGTGLSARLKNIFSRDKK